MESLRNQTGRREYENLLQVGAVTTTHGVRGEVKVFPTTDDSRRFEKLKEAVLETKDGLIPVHIEHVKYFKQFVILKFKEFQTLDEVETFRQCRLFVTRENAVKLHKNEYFIADLIGMRVTDPDKQLSGTVTDVLQTGANDVYEIELEDKRKFLLPAIKDCVQNIDPDQGTIEIHILDGLLDS